MLKILLAEDNPIDEAALIQYLKINLGTEFSYDNVKSCKELLELLEKGSEYDIVILDHILEDEQSLKYIDKITTRSKGAKILVLSGQTDISVCIQYLNAGVYAYLNKETNAFKNVVKNINEILSKKKGDITYFKIDKRIFYFGLAGLIIIVGIVLWLLS